jgi:nucleoside-diphosphate-sugar epimerase
MIKNIFITGALGLVGKELIKSLLKEEKYNLLCVDLKKQVFNDKHDIRIFGYDVELYAQDVEESHYSSGVYSVMNNEWISEPKKFKNVSILT